MLFMAQLQRCELDWLFRETDGVRASDYKGTVSDLFVAMEMVLHPDCGRGYTARHMA